MTQWLRICLPMQGLRFHPWSGKIPHAMGQLSLCATTTESVLQSLQFTTSEASMPEVSALQLESSPLLAVTRESLSGNEDPVQP